MRKIFAGLLLYLITLLNKKESLDKKKIFLNKFKKEKEFESEGEKSVNMGKMKKISDQKNRNECKFDLLNSHAAGMTSCVKRAVTRYLGKPNF